ncbi:hypothetical protein KP509_04G023600 [Ceratopteris richardii]|uniref:Cytochrome P450 n=1 Tax=Ceratopteris richardii TaxID=49495 RepID=A0A8T2V350_CERRI|nr:hypothetical protein KP509_04G023600 [Ceratopteris richardii]
MDENFLALCMGVPFSASSCLHRLALLLLPTIIWGLYKLSFKLRRGTRASSNDVLSLPPGPRGMWRLLQVPWAGEGLQFLAAMRAGHPEHFLFDRGARYSSNTFRTLIFGHRIVMVQGAAANRFVANAEKKGLLRNSWPSTVLRVVGNHAPVVKHGAEHRRFRQILSTCLSPLPLQKLVERASRITYTQIDTHWLPHARCSINTSTEFHDSCASDVITMMPLLRLHTFRLACNLLADISDEKILSRLHKSFKIWLAGMLDLPLNLPGSPYSKSLRARDELLREMGKLIDVKLASRECRQLQFVDSERDVDVLSLLLRAQADDGSFLSYNEMKDTLLFLLFAGHDTNTASLAFTLKYLEQYPACYDQVVQEQEAIAASKNEGEELSWDDVQSMKYTWKVVQEALRLWPPVLGGMKEAMDDIVFDGYLIPKGWKVEHIYTH